MPRESVETTVEVTHVRLTTRKPFAEVRATFEGRLGRFDPGPVREALGAGDVEGARARLEGMVGPSGLMLFGEEDHGAVLELVGPRREAIQYVVGNPLIAIEMTRHALGSALYAPLRFLLSVLDDGRTCVEYDRPSTLFGQFGDAAVDEVAASLDAKVARLLDFLDA